MKMTNRFSFFLAAAFVVFLGRPGSALADDYSWINGSNGNWSNSSLWSPSGVPSGGDDAALVTGTAAINDGDAFNPDSVTVGHGGTAAVNLTGGSWDLGSTLILGYQGTGSLNMSGGEGSADTTYLGFFGNDTGVMTLSAGTWTTNDLEMGYGFAGIGSSGTLTITGGTFHSTGDAHIGANVGNQGAVSISAGALTVDGALAVGYQGDGSLSISGGQVSASTMTVGGVNGYNPTGIVTLSSGTLSASDFFLGNGIDASGDMTITGGFFVNDSSATLGVQSGDEGTLSISGGRWQTVSGVEVGFFGAGTVNLTDSGTIQVGDGTGEMDLSAGFGDGTLNIGTGGTAGTLLAGSVSGGSGDAEIYFNHTGTVNFSTLLFNNLIVNQQAGTTILSAVGSDLSFDGIINVNSGTLVVGDGGLINVFDVNVNAGTFQVDGNSVVGIGDELDVTNGDVEISNGGSLSTGFAVIGDGGTGSVNLLDGSWLNDGDTIQVGNNGTGTVNLAADFSADTVQLGVNRGDHGYLNISGGLSTIGTELDIGYQGTGSVSLTGGEIDAQNTYLGDLAGSNGIATISGGTWSSPSSFYVGVGGTGSLTVTGGYIYSSDFRIGAGSSGSATISGGEIDADFLEVGSSNSHGELSISGGLVHDSQEVDIGDGFSSGLVTMTDGTWNADGSINVNGNGTLNFQGGQAFTSVLSVSPGASVEISGGTFSAEQMFLSFSGSSSLSITGGILNDNDGNNNAVGLGEGVGATGEVDISGGQWILPDSESFIGDVGSGIVHLTDSGTMQVGDGSGLLILGNQSGASGELDFGTGGTAGTLLAGEVTTGQGTGVVNFNETNTGTFGARLTGNLDVNQIGSGTTVLTAEASQSGPTTISAGAIKLANGGWIDGNITDNSRLIFARSDTVTYSSVISGTGSVIQSGSGTLILNQDNTYSGTTVISAGVVQVGDGGSSGSLGTGDVLDNHILAFNRGDTFAFSNNISGPGVIEQIGSGTTMLTGNNTGTGFTDIEDGALMVGDGGATGSLSSGSILDNAVLAFNRSDAITVANTIDGTGQVVQSGSGSVTLTGSNTYSGGTLITGGTVNIATDANLGDASGVLTIDGGTIHNTTDLTTSRSVVLGSNGATFALGVGFLTFFNPFSGDGGLTKTGGNFLTLTGDQTYLGATDVEGGFFKVDGGSLASSSVHLAANTIFYFVNGTSSYDGAITGDGHLVIAGGVKTLTGDSSFDGGTEIQDGTLQLGDGDTSGSVTGTIADSGLLAFDRSDNYAFDGTINGTGVVSQIGSGTTILSGSNSYSGGTVISNGLINFTDASNFGTGNITLDGGGLQWAAGNTTDISSRLNAITSNSGVFDTNGNNVTLASSITGDGGITKTGDGTLTLSGSNNYAGSTSIIGGTLAISADDNLGGGNVDLESGGVLETTQTAEIAHFISFNGGAISVDPAKITTLTGILFGSGGLNKQGGGTLDISGASFQVTGANTVSSGTLIASAANGFAGSVALSNDSTLDFLEASDGTFFDDITGDGSVAKDGDGTLTLASTNNTYSGDTIINHGALSISSAANLGSGNLQINNGSLVTTESLALDATITVGSGSVSPDAGTTLTLQGAISGSDFFKEGAGTVVLSGTNSSSSTSTHIDQGILSISAARNLGTGTIDLNGGDLEFTGALALGNAITLTSGGFLATGPLAVLNGQISGTGNFVLDGAGTVVLGNTNNNFTGNVIVDSGTLSTSFDQSFGGGNEVVLNGGGLGLSSFTSARNFVFNGGTISGGGPATVLTGTLTGTAGLKLTSGSLDITGATFQVTGTHSVQSGNLIVSAATGFQGDVNDNGTLDFREATDGTYADRIFGSGTVAKDGSGTLTLSGTSNSYTGDTSINTGAISISSASSLGRGGLQLHGDAGLLTTASLSLDANIQADSGYVSPAAGTTLTLNGVITSNFGNNGSFIKQGAGTVVLTASNSLLNTTISQGILSISSAANLGSGSLTIRGGALEVTQSLTLGQTISVGGDGFIVDAGQTATLNGDLTSNGFLGVTKSGDGTLVLGSSDNSFTGNTAVNAGILSISSDGSLGHGILVSLNGGTLETTQSLTTNRDITTTGGAISVDAGQTTTVSGAIDGSDLSVVGSGTLVLASVNNSYTGTTSLRGGTLVAASNNAVGTSVVHASAGTFLVNDGVTISNTVVLSGGAYDRVLDDNADLQNSVNSSSHFAEGHDTSAALLQGTLTTGATLQTSFAATSAAINDDIRQSDVYSFHGTGSDLFVLQLSITSTSPADYLAWLNGDNQWVNAISGNTGNNATDGKLDFQGSFADFEVEFGTNLSLYIGAWGIDTSGGQTSVWAVLDHNSDYSIVTAPEPATWALLAGGLGLIFVLRRRRC